MKVFHLLVSFLLVASASGMKIVFKCTETSRACPGQCCTMDESNFPGFKISASLLIQGCYDGKFGNGEKNHNQQVCPVIVNPCDSACDRLKTYCATNGGSWIC